MYITVVIRFAECGVKFLTSSYQTCTMNMSLKRGQRGSKAVRSLCQLEWDVAHIKCIILIIKFVKCNVKIFHKLIKYVHAILYLHIL